MVVYGGTIIGCIKNMHSHKLKGLAYGKNMPIMQICLISTLCLITLDDYKNEINDLVWCYLYH